MVPGSFAICRLPVSDPIPEPAGAFWSVTRTADELSVVCEEGHAPFAPRVEAGWVCLRVDGTLDFSLTGVLSSIAEPLAQAGISLFVMSTYDTDYVLLKRESLPAAIRALRDAGHQVG
ncbi:MAG: ACT domain-containing protein [Bryobacteraceae bacterium]|nr:ACT domain-containing protein [Bryobacteraceae bacterium]